MEISVILLFAIDWLVHRQCPVVHYWTILEIKYNKNSCLCQFSNDSDYVFRISIISIIDITE